MIAKLRPNRVRSSYLGGSRIDVFCGLPEEPFNSSTLQPFNPPGTAQPRPEDWLASTTQAFNGTEEIEGEGLGRLEDGRLVRDAVGALPILVKLLDSDERLVVQAHPTVPCARRLFHSPVGKTECWYVLPGTAPDACVHLGFKPGITRSAWENAVTSHAGAGDVTAFLHRIPVAPGDFVFVDGGVPHAIGGGCFLVELQEPSDLMVVAERFTPSGRRIPDAKMHGGAGWERMFDVYEYEGRSYEETCRACVRRGNDDRPADAARMRAIADRTLAELRAEYFTPTGRCTEGTQTGLLLALHHHLSPDEARTRRDLAQKMAQCEGRLKTGFVGTPILCEELMKAGMEEQAFRLLVNEEYPGWLYSVKLGATTVWERWNSILPDGSISSTGMNSLNHYAYGSIVAWLYRDVAGIAPAEPGFRSARLRPHVSRTLGSVEAEYISAAGTWRAAWQILPDGRIRYRCTVPFGCTATLDLPRGGGHYTLQPGDFTHTYTPDTPV